MLSIKPSSVPEYLKDSALFANLGKGEDEEVSVPLDCCKQDTYVANVAELEDLLRSLRFWGVDCLPYAALKFIIGNQCECLDPVLENFARDLPTVANIIQVLKCPSDRQVCEAVEIGSVDLATCLLEHGYLGNYLDDHLFPVRAVDCSSQGQLKDLTDSASSVQLPFLHQNRNFCCLIW